MLRRVEIHQSEHIRVRRKHVIDAQLINVNECRMSLVDVRRRDDSARSERPPLHLTLGGSWKLPKPKLKHLLISDFGKHLKGARGSSPSKEPLSQIGLLSLAYTDNADYEYTHANDLFDLF